MRFQFKTSYNQDIRIFRDKVDGLWYGLLAVAVVVLPLLLDDYSVGEISWVFIYGICGVSLMVLVGYTGLVSLATPLSSASAPTLTAISSRSAFPGSHRSPWRW